MDTQSLQLIGTTLLAVVLLFVARWCYGQRGEHKGWLIAAVICALIAVYLLYLLIRYAIAFWRVYGGF